MKLLRLAVSIIGAVVVLTDPDYLLLEGQQVMARKAAADDTGKAVRSPPAAPARDPAIAVAEEYELARQKGTAEAFELFIARHGDDPLAEKARAELRRLSR
jgi:predicted Abi (CAAX) family protease